MMSNPLPPQKVRARPPSILMIFNKVPQITSNSLLYPYSLRFNTPPLQFSSSLLGAKVHFTFLLQHTATPTQTNPLHPPPSLRLSPYRGHCFMETFDRPEPIDWHGLAAHSEPPAWPNCFHVCLRVCACVCVCDWSVCQGAFCQSVIGAVIAQTTFVDKRQSSMMLRFILSCLFAIVFTSPPNEEATKIP